jgi:hypothetical protein
VTADVEEKAFGKTRSNVALAAGRLMAPVIKSHDIPKLTAATGAQRF